MNPDSMRGMGWLPDVPSVKDFTEEHPTIAPLIEQTRMARRVHAHRGVAGSGGTAAAPASAPATRVDLRPWCSPIEDQEQLGSCTANAAVALIEYFERKALGRHIDASRLFVYKVSRDLLGLKGDTGAYLRTAMHALTCFGAPPEKYWPYDGRAEGNNKRFDVEPTAFCYAFAASFQSLKYYRLDPNGAAPAAVLNNIRTYLAAEMPAMFGIPAYDELMKPLPGGLIPFPGQNSHLYGGHAIVAIGYDDNLKIGADKGALLIRNSWGTGWGDAGYGWMSYRYVTEGLAQDWWTVLSQKWVDTDAFK